MASFMKLFNLIQKTRDAAKGNLADLEGLHASIHALAIQAFMSDVLTLGRMTAVLHAMQKGIEDSATRSYETDLSKLALAQRGAYRGLCLAACEGLTAAELAYAEFIQLNGAMVSVDFKKAIEQEALELKHQFDQIINSAGWRSNAQIGLLQTHWFRQLSNIEASSFRVNDASKIPWNSRFFQLCGYEPMAEKNETQANLMLLGLITNGALSGLKNFQPAG